jgi:hypothetical protein
MDFQPHGQFESPVLKRLSSVQAFSETRSAYYAVCWLLRRDHEPYDALSPVSRTRRRSPEVSSTAFPARPPNLPPRPLMTMDFAISCSSGRVGLVIRFLSIGPQVCSTLPSDFASRRRPCASLTLRRHQAGYRTFTSKLSNILGTQQKGPAEIQPALRVFDCVAPRVSRWPCHSVRCRSFPSSHRARRRRQRSACRSRSSACR